MTKFCPTCEKEFFAKPNSQARYCYSCRKRMRAIPFGKLVDAQNRSILQNQTSLGQIRW